MSTGYGTVVTAALTTAAQQCHNTWNSYHMTGMRQVMHALHMYSMPIQGVPQSSCVNTCGTLNTLVDSTGHLGMHSAITSTPAGKTCTQQMTQHIQQSRVLYGSQNPQLYCRSLLLSRQAKRSDRQMPQPAPNSRHLRLTPANGTSPICHDALSAPCAHMACERLVGAVHLLGVRGHLSEAHLRTMGLPAEPGCAA